MLFAEEIVFKDESYDVVLEEKDCLVMTLINDHKPIWKSYRGKALGKYILKDFKLVLEDLHLQEKLLKKDEKLLDRLPEVDEETGDLVFYQLNNQTDYSGGIVIVKDLIETFDHEKEFPCYCYKTVYELIFDKGALVTAIDHSKAMVRIRKNITLGLRNVNNKKDQRCIQKFMDESFYKKYKKRHKLQKMKRSLYQTKYWNS